MMEPKMMTVGESLLEHSPIQLNPLTLLKHVMVLGSSGSGKTYLSKVILEEAIRLNIPVIAIDTQGDIASMGIKADPDLQTAAIANDYWKKVDVKIWTPGSEWGIPMSIQPKLDLDAYERREDRVRAVHAMGVELAALAGSNSEADAAGMSKIIDYANRHDLVIETVDDVCDFLKDPPQPLADELMGIFDQRDRLRVLRSLLIKKNGPRQLMLELGQPIDMDALFGREPGGAYDQGRVRLSIISLKGLVNPEDQQVWLSNFARNFYTWMLTDPRATIMGLLFIDEMAPFMPPVKKPVCKEPLMLLIRQARKFGYGIVLASQSPGDVEYKGMGQIGTKFIGRMTTYQEVDKVSPLFEHDPHEILTMIPELRTGEFVCVSPDSFINPRMFKSRSIVSKHITMTLEEVGSLVKDEDRVNYG